MLAVSRKGSGRVPGAVVAIAVAIVLSMLGTAPDLPSVSESAATTSSLAHDGLSIGTDQPAEQLLTPVKGEPLLACGVALLCLLALLIAAARIRNRSAGSWPAPVPEPARPMTCTPCSDVLPSPHLSGRLIC